MKKNLISAIAGWKSAALLALVAMVAAVAFSGVLTNTPAEAQNGPDATINPGEMHSFKVEVEEGAGAPTVNLPTGATAANTGEVDVATAADTEDPADTTKDTYTVTFEAADLAIYRDVALTTGTDPNIVTVQTIRIAPATAPVGGAGVVIVDASGADTNDNVYNISSDSTADATFTANPGRSFVICPDTNPGGACDVEDTDDTTEGNQGFVGVVHLSVTVAKDAEVGQIVYITQGTDRTTERQIVVRSADAQPADFTAEAADGDASVAAGGATATIEVNVTDDQTPPGAVNDYPLIFVTTDGDLKVDAAGGCVDAATASDATSKTCTTSTMGGDGATAEVSSAAPGTVTVTVLAGKLGAKDVEVTFFGAAADVSASSEQSSVEYGGELTVTLTVTDADGRAVVGGAGKVLKAVTDHIEGPSDDAAGVSVKLSAGVDEEAPHPQYCTSEGTDGKGQCVAIVSAAGGPNPATGGAWTINFMLGSTDAEGKPTTLTESITLTVAGPPANIANDAEERYDQRAVATVTLTVTDEDGNLVGTQPISVDVVDGSVALLDKPDMTKNGEASFTFVVRSNADGSAAFLARSGDAASIIEIAVGPAPVVEEEVVVEEPPALAAPTSVTIAASDDGVLSVSASGAAEGDTTEAEVRANGGAWAAVSEEAAAPGTYQARARFVRGDESTDWVYSSNVVTIAEPEPEPDPPTWNNELVSGQNLVVWNGADGADASAGAAEGVTAIWSYNTGSGSWDGYFPGAADVPGGNTLTSLSNGQAYVVIVE